MAQAQLGLGNNTEALAAGNRVVGLAPEDEWGHRLCSIALDRMGNTVKATRAAQEAVRLDPNNWRTHQCLAATVVGVGSTAVARDAAARAVELAPDEPSAHFAVGLAAQRRGDRKTAKRVYQRTLALDPTHAMAHNNLTVLGGSRNLGHAARGYGRSLQHDPTSDVTQGNVTMLARRFARRIYWMGLAAFLVGDLVALASRGELTLLGVLTALVILGVVAGYTALLARNVPRGVRRFVVLQLRDDPYLLTSVILASVVVGIAIITCVVPHGDTVGWTALYYILIATGARRVWRIYALRRGA